MKYQHLGKTHYVHMATIKVSIMQIIVIVASLFIGFLIYAWKLIPLSLSGSWLLCYILGLLLSKGSEVPFCKECFFHPLKGRVSLDP